MKAKSLLLVTLVSSLATGCASGLNSMQKREYQAFKQNNVLVEEKNPTTGAVLGILPGGGSFYAREPGLGIVNLLLWPASVLWDPVSGYEGAMEINYDITKQKLQKDKDQEVSRLDDKLATGQIDNTEYVLAKRQIEQKYSFE
ncbi:hypothetical protein [Zobellella iuensis]|uniref:Lipoprotein n=1 Tax=Zobellella iuensis TaxID=2803811 RepID=A0ABS1QS50_9GAMM|nr:hypothetical protein [Zobellella iuensis]MBL1377670.1 hypothetical protein [Zobellella iuensis]